MSIVGPNLKLLYGLDEGQAGATRVNSGSVGSAMDLEVWRADAGTTLAVISDGRGGKMVLTDQNTAPITAKSLRGIGLGEVGDTPATLPYFPDLTTIFAADSGLGVTFGARFRFTTIPSGVFRGFMFGFANHPDSLVCNPFPLAMQGDFSGTGGVGVLMVWAPAKSTANSGHVAAGTGTCVLSASSPNTPSPADAYLADGKTYSVVVRIVNDAYFGSGTTSIYTWLKNETDAEEYRWEQSESDSKFQSTVTALQTYLNIAVGGAPEGKGSGGYADSFPGYMDQCWWYEGVLTDAEVSDILVSGLTVPWVEPSIRRADHVVYSALTDEDGTYPKTRPLPTGATVCRHPVDVFCQEIRTRLEGWRPGRPWAHRYMDLTLDPAGPFGSHRAREAGRPDMSLGVIRAPGRKPWGACEDARNMLFTREGPRRRRGFKVRRDVSSESSTAFNAFYTWRDNNDQLHWIYKVGSKLYVDDGSTAVEVDTGWSPSEPACGFKITGRQVILSATKQVLSRGETDGVDTLSVAAPASCVAAAGPGGTLNGTYIYAVTLYDPSSGDETGPVISNSVSPSTEKVTLTLPATAPDTRFTQYRIYRTTDGGSAPNFLFLTTIGVAATWDDTGVISIGSTLIGQVNDASTSTFLGYITTVHPENFAIGCEHQERAFYSQGDSNPERVYVFEANSPNRNFSDQWFAADGPVRAIVSWNGRLVVFTDNTTEIVESDWVRDADGILDLQRRVVSRRVGALSQNGVLVWGANLWWIDYRGIFRMQGTTPTEMSDAIFDIFPYINTNQARGITAGWDHVSRHVWFSVPCAALQADDNSRMQTQIVGDLERPGRWTFHSLEAAFVSQFDDDAAGLKFGAIDHLGVFKELNSYEGDGAEGDEAFTTEDAGTDDYATSPAGIVSVSGKVVTAYGTPGWTSNALRGMGVILRDRSTGLLRYYTVEANGTDNFTCEREVSTALAAGDGYYIGGMDAFVQYAGYDFNSRNRKVVRQVQHTFADLTKEDLYL